MMGSWERNLSYSSQSSDLLGTYHRYCEVNVDQVHVDKWWFGMSDLNHSQINKLPYKRYYLPDRITISQIGPIRNTICRDHYYHIKYGGPVRKHVSLKIGHFLKGSDRLRTQMNACHEDVKDYSFLGNARQDHYSTDEFGSGHLSDR